MIAKQAGRSATLDNGPIHWRTYAAALSTRKYPTPAHTVQNYSFATISKEIQQCIKALSNTGQMKMSTIQPKKVLDVYLETVDNSPCHFTTPQLLWFC